MKHIIVDLDGTLTNVEHRLHYLKETPPNWDAFFLACSDDKPNWPVLYTVAALYDYFADDEVRIVFFSGRGAIARGATVTWLAEYQVQYDELHMRKEGDFRPDNTLKMGWLEEIGVDNVLFCIDDRQSVVDMWRDMGLTCFQVAPGDF